MALHNKSMDTLAALRDGQRRREQDLKEDEKDLAARKVRKIVTKKKWTEEDMDEILYALGLKTWMD